MSGAAETEARPSASRRAPGGPPARGDRQRTLAGEATFAGVGLFTGVRSTLKLRPAGPNEGITFVRTDLPGSPSAPARIEFVIDRPRRTTIKRGEAEIETIEHCMSALAGLGVDNAVVEIDGPETPVGDGSAAPFVEAVRRAGVVEQDAERRPLVVTAPVTVSDGSSMVVALPIGAPVMEVLYDLDYGEGSALGRQSWAFTLSPDTYAERVAPARTFALREEAEAMRERGMFRHLTPRDMLIIGPTGPIDNAYRFENEPVRHKALDLIGDLALVGRPLHARIVASRSGHAMNHRLARALLEAEARTGPSARRGVEDGAPAARATAPVVRDDGSPPAMDVKQVLRLLPHRYPMVLVDRVLEIESDQRAVGIKNVTMNEPFFQGHYPGSPIMPGVLIVEAMGQLAGLMLSQKLERTGKIAILLSLDDVKLRKPVTPGDQLLMETEAVRATGRFGDVQCRAFVAGALVAEARIKFMMVDAEQG